MAEITDSLQKIVEAFDGFRPCLFKHNQIAHDSSDGLNRDPVIWILGSTSVARIITSDPSLVAYFIPGGRINYEIGIRLCYFALLIMADESTIDLRHVPDDLSGPWVDEIDKVADHIVQDLPVLRRGIHDDLIARYNRLSDD